MDNDVLIKIKKRLERLGDKNIGEAQTKESFINPLIAGLGWDTSDFDEVRLEYRHTRKDTPVDYALMINMAPKLFIEAKQLGLNLDDHKWTAQILTYATMAGVKWAILTDGNHYKLFNTMAEAKLDEKLLFEWKMKELSEDDLERVLYFLNLLTIEKLKDNAIEIAWKNHFEVTKVEAALKKLVSEKDESLLNLIHKKTKLGRSAIANSLDKLKVGIERIHPHELPLVPTPLEPQRYGFTGKIPNRISIFGESYDVKYWRDVLVRVAESLIQKNPDVFYRLADSELMKGDKRVYLSKNAGAIIGPRKLSNGLYLFVGLSANSIVRIINRLLIECGYNASDIKYFFR